MLFSPETRKKLSALRRGRRPAAQVPVPPNERPPEPEPEAPAEPGPASARTELAGAPVPVEALFAGEVVEGPFGTCYVMRPELGPLGASGGALAEGLRACAPDAPGLDAVFVDIETLGLSSMPVFLVGVLTCRDEGAELTQILARDFPEEAALLAETGSLLRGAQTLYSYNGATFDLPLLEERAIYHAVEWWLDAEHVDLLKPARKRFRGRFADCKLQTLETHLCGRRREGDIPGAEIPRRFQDFVRSGDGRLLESVIHHNQLDLVTLAELVPHCLA